MNLYVWTGVLWDYSPGIMFAKADTVEEARALLRKECAYLVAEDLAKQPQVFGPDDKCAFYEWGGG